MLLFYVGNIRYRIVYNYYRRKYNIYELHSLVGIQNVLETMAQSAIIRLRPSLY